MTGAGVSKGVDVCVSSFIYGIFGDLIQFEIQPLNPAPYHVPTCQGLWIPQLLQLIEGDQQPPPLCPHHADLGGFLFGVGSISVYNRLHADRL